jgi:hypothetical protein
MAAAKFKESTVVAHSVPQDFAHHVRIDPAFHLFILPTFAISWIISVVVLVRYPRFYSAWGVVLATATVVAIRKFLAWSKKRWSRNSPAPTLRSRSTPGGPTTCGYKAGPQTAFVLT